MDLAPTAPLDAGAPFVVRGPEGDDLHLDLIACDARGCTCNEAVILLWPRHDEGSNPIARVRFDLASGTVLKLDDRRGALPAERAEAWLRDLFAGDDGARMVERVNRTRAQLDRRTWQRFDWGARGRERAVPYHELFPLDWTLRAKDTPPLWVHEGYCVRPGCDCQDVTLVVADGDGVVTGKAVVRLHGAEAATVKTCDHAVVEVIRSLATSRIVVHNWHKRFREVRELVRFRKTWSTDVADPEQAVLRLLRDRGPLPRAYVYNLGDHIVPALRAVIDDETRPTADRARAVALLIATAGTDAVTIVAAALASPWLSADASPELFEEVVDTAAEMGLGLADRLLAGLSHDSPDAVIAVLANYSRYAPTVASALDARLENAPVRWLPIVAASPDAVPRVRRLLDRAMAAEPIDLELANAAVDKLIDLGEDVDGDIIDRLDGTWTDEDDVPPPAATLKPRVAPRPAAPPPPPPLVGGNRPCWCGSGKKRKLCHRAEEPTP